VRKFYITQNVVKIMALSGVLTSMLACSVNETATVVVHDDGNLTQTIESNSDLLAANLSIIDTKVGFVGELLRAQVEIRNASGDVLNFQYKFKWLDKSGFEMAIGERPWHPISITPYESKRVQGVAPTLEVNSFTILVQD